MNALTQIQPAHTACRECDGTGGFALDGNDPWGRTRKCESCGGSGFEIVEPCAVCACFVRVDGHDCPACDFAGYLPAKGFDHTKIAIAFALAINAGVVLA